MNQQQPDLGSMLSGLLGKGGQGQGGQGGGALAKLLPAVMGMLAGQGGGNLSGLLSKLQSSGLGAQAKSWVDPNAANAQVSPQQVTEALGDQQISQLAQQAGVSPQEAASGLATALPQVVDTLTPQGQVPQSMPNYDPGQFQRELAKVTNS